MTTSAISTTISSIFNSRVNILELLEIQKYKIDDYKYFTISDVHSMHANNQLDMLLEKEQSDGRAPLKIYVRYCLDKAIRSANLEEFIDDLFNLEPVLNKDDTLFIIQKDEINDPITNSLKQIWENDGIFIVVESIKRLQFNVLKHSLVPAHSIVPESDVEDIMRKYNISDKSEFPEISRFEPVAKAIGIRPGQLCHIIRPSKTAVTTDYYRLCI